MTIPQDIVQALGIAAGMSVTFEVQGDVVIMHRADSTTPVDLVTRDVFDLTGKVRELKTRELELEESYLKDLDRKNRIDKLGTILLSEKMLLKEFERLKKEIQKVIDTIEESFHLPELRRMEDVFLLERYFGGTSTSEYDAAIEFIQGINRKRQKYVKLAERTRLLAEEKKIDFADSTDIEAKFMNEVMRCQTILKKMAEVASVS